MKTLRLTLDAHDPNSGLSRSLIGQAASILRNGGLVAFPTETVYGLGANALDANAVAKIFTAKRRPAWDPLIVHVSSRDMLADVADVGLLSTSTSRLMDAFWPGPLTLLQPKVEAVPSIVTAGRPLVGVRMPAHPVARALIAATGVPVAAPSANSFGRTSPTRAAHVLEDLDGRIDAVLDFGETAHGLESTVVDASQSPVVVYRPGVVTLEQIQRVCGSATLWQTDRSEENRTDPTPESMPSPGVGIRHYAPKARLILVEGGPESGPLAHAAAFEAAIEKALQEQHRVGIMLPRNFLAHQPPGLENRSLIFDWGNWQDTPQLAHRLFLGLRELDAAGVGLILCPLPAPEGIGAAIRDRLLKGART